jgi:hypothetical protein
MTGTSLPSPRKIPESGSAPRGAARRDATFVPLRRGPRGVLTTRSAEEIEHALLREFLRCKSVAGLAQSVAARLGDGRTAEEIIAAADEGVLRGLERPRPLSARAIVEDQAF